MRAPIRISLVAAVAFLVCLALSTTDASAKGKGGGKVRGAGKAHSGFGGSKGGQGRTRVQDRFSTRGRRTIQDHHLDRQPDTRDWSTRGRDRWGADRHTADRHTSYSDDSSSHPWSMQRANEDRKLNHRLDVADKLDQLAERNGNPKLHETAQRKREQAWEHYEKRLQKINSKDPNHVPPEEGEMPNGDDVDHGDADDHDHADGEMHDHGDADDLNDEPLDEIHSPSDGVARTSDPVENAFDTAERLTGRENALYRQLRNEQRKLDQRMEAAERLWETYEQTGNEAFAEAARELEDRALAHFDQRLKAIRSFQERHGLSDQVGQALEEVNDVAPAGEFSVLVNPVQ